MPITALPTPPTRSDPATFAARGDAFMLALPTFATEANALQTDVNAKQVLVDAAAAAIVADAVQTALDRVATGADVVLTAADVIAAAASAAAALASQGVATTKAGEAVVSAAAAEVARAAAVVAQNNAVATVTGGTASLTAAVSKIPISDAAAVLDPSWLENNQTYQRLMGAIAFATDLAGHAAGSPLVLTPGTPSGTTVGNPGNVAFDASYLYVCTAKNVWKRIALTAF